MNLSSTTYCRLGFVLIIASILGLSIALLHSSQVTGGAVALKVPLPLTGSSAPLSPEQLAEIRNDPESPILFWQAIGVPCIEASFLVGSFLLGTGIVMHLRKIDHADNKLTGPPRLN